LLIEEGIDVGIAAVGVGAVARNDLGEARGRVAVERARADTYPLGLLGGDQGEVGAALHGAHLETDAHRLEVADDRLPEGKVWGKLVELSRLETVGIARLGQELLGLRRVVGMRLEGQGELAGPRDVIARRLRGARRLRCAPRSA